MASNRAAVKDEPERDPGRPHRFVAEHSARCAAAKHEDWQHGTTGCAVGPLNNPAHCDCRAHWEEG
jgi:hypothetical protein